MSARGPVARWRTLQFGKVHQLWRGREHLATVQRTALGWYSYGMAGVRWNSANAPEPDLATCKTDAKKRALQQDQST